MRKKLEEILNKNARNKESQIFEYRSNIVAELKSNISNLETNISQLEEAEKKSLEEDVNTTRKNIDSRLLHAKSAAYDIEDEIEKTKKYFETPSGKFNLIRQVFSEQAGDSEKKDISGGKTSLSVNGLSEEVFKEIENKIISTRESFKDLIKESEALKTKVDVNKGNETTEKTEDDKRNSAAEEIQNMIEEVKEKLKALDTFEANIEKLKEEVSEKKNKFVSKYYNDISKNNSAKKSVNKQGQWISDIIKINEKVKAEIIKEIEEEINNKTKEEILEEMKKEKEKSAIACGGHAHPLLPSLNSKSEQEIRSNRIAEKEEKN